MSAAEFAPADDSETPGQDWSLLWWLFLTSFFSGACIVWLKGRYRELQPFVIATLMSVLIFLAILMLFAANPFRTLVSGAPPDGAPPSTGYPAACQAPRPPSRTAMFSNPKYRNVHHTRGALRLIPEPS